MNKSEYPFIHLETNCLSIPYVNITKSCMYVTSSSHPRPWYIHVNIKERTFLWSGSMTTLAFYLNDLFSKASLPGKLQFTIKTNFGMCGTLNDINDILRPLSYMEAIEGVIDY
jgi:hypothetical protein